ncbi:MAG: right-handed parallel beta-helix repeat-containing protein [Leptolyngbya sp. DLM2.Bin15]|nr:MAG: right-handed parallel beta-helix repeat-containing protein [Leptolyngbya sp. DLM2.Bin15]
MNMHFLETVFSDNGIKYPKFFDGRILTAEDLRDEQTANLQRSRLLGQAIGDGVVHGLQVSADGDRRALRIKGGLAINRQGDPLQLVRDTTLTLVSSQRLTPSITTPFIPCNLPTESTLTGTVATGYYLLAITPATRLSTAMAPNAGLSGDRPGCTNRYEEMGVQFKLVSITIQEFVPSSSSGLNNRSRLAHLCFGTQQRSAHAQDPMHSVPDYGLVYTLRQAKRLTDCDVPLALFYYQNQQLEFIDTWAVRRPCLQNGQDDAWGQPSYPLVGDRQTLEAQAFLLQFQHQLDDIRSTIGVNIKAIDYFEYLPAFGFLPTGRSSIINVNNLIRDRIQSRQVRRTSLPGFNINTFLAGTRFHHVSLAPEQIRDMLHQSFHYPAIDPLRDDINIYPVAPSPNQESYVVFMRRTLSRQHSTASGTCTYRLTPSNWQTSITQMNHGVNDIHICLQAGVYNLAQPLVIKNKGHVKVTGAGLGTRLLCNQAERVLVFENCQSVIVRDLYAQSGVAQTPEKRQHLQGALHFYNCQDVRVEHTSLRCANHSQRTATCLTVRSSESSTVRIQNCNLHMGDRQLGILIVNARYAQVDNNHLTTTQAGTPASQGIVVGGSIANDIRILNNRIEHTLQGIHLGLSQREPSRGSPLSIENLLIAGNTIYVSFPNLSGGVNERHGIFVGNCKSLVIENNYLSLQRFRGTAASPIDSIRVHGFLGRRIIIRQNHLTRIGTFGGFSRPVNVTNLSSPPANAILEHNFFE